MWYYYYRNHIDLLREEEKDAWWQRFCMATLPLRKVSCTLSNDMVAILFDLPEVIELSKKRFITEESDYVANRTRFVAGDFFSGLVPQSDAYILKWILHDWDDQHCMQILNNIKASMKPSSKLLIIDEVLTKYDPLPVKKRFSDLVMMTMLHGKERAKEDFQSLFEAVGLKLDGVFNMRGPVSLIQASLRHSD